MNYKIELTPDEVMLIGAGLDLLPHGKVSALVRKVQGQINGQDAAAAVTPPDPPQRKPGRPQKLRAVPIEVATDHGINGDAAAVSQGA